MVAQVEADSHADYGGRVVIEQERAFQAFCYPEKKFRPLDYELNEMQRKILAALNRGLSVHNTAKLFRVKEHTIRNHINNLRSAGFDIRLNGS